MEGKRALKGLLVCMATLGCCLPEVVVAATGTPASAVVDVALRDRGVLIGQVVDVQGRAVAKSPVSLREQNRELAKSMTDANGYFAFSGLRGGVYQLTAAEGNGTYRLWTPGTAPPSCEAGALVVGSGTTIRGQCADGACAAPACAPPRGGCGGFLCSPWVIAGVVATAVAVPIAVHNHHRRPASP